MWYLKKFETMPDYENFKSGNGNTDFIEPNVSYIINDDKVNFTSYNPKIWFKIENETVYAYPGMTFEQWANSEEFNPKGDGVGYWFVDYENEMISWMSEYGYEDGILYLEDRDWGCDLRVPLSTVITEGMQVYVGYL